MPRFVMRRVQMTIPSRNAALRITVAIGLLSALQCVANASDSPPITPEQVLSMRVVRGPSGRFAAYGTNILQVSDMARWSDGLATRLDRLLGVTPPHGRPPMRLVITDDQASTSGWVKVTSSSPVLHIAVANYEAVDIQAVCRALVGGLLADFMTWGMTQGTVAVTAPDWLVTGVMRNMDVDTRESDYDEVFIAWQDGRLPPLAECLSGLASGSSTNAAVTGVLVQWMISIAGKGVCVRDVMSRSAGGAAPKADWFYAFAGCTIPADLDAAWEQWLVGRQWVVGAPGRKTAWLVQRIRSERLIYQADSGIPKGKPDDPPLTMADLIRERKTWWARSAASSRAVRLRLLAAGRAKEVAEVLNAYSVFLEAVQSGKGEAQLRDLLADADRLFAALEAGMAGGASAVTNSAPGMTDGRMD